MEAFSRYLPIDDAIFASPLFLTSAGCGVIPPGVPYPPAGHPDLYHFDWREGRVLPEFSLVWIVAGAGGWENRHGCFLIRAGQVGQVFAGEWHRYRPEPGTGWTECWLQFNGRLAHELKLIGLSPEENPVRSPELPERFSRQFQELLEDVRAPGFVNSASHGLRVAGLLGLLHLSPASASRGSSLVERAASHIWSYSHRQISVDEVAGRLGVGRRTLERAFAAEGRHGVLEEITRCRLNRVERLLRETRLPLKHIAGLSGFGTTEQMRLQFRAKHGQSPGRYREAARWER